MSFLKDRPPRLSDNGGGFGAIPTSTKELESNTSCCFHILLLSNSIGRGFVSKSSRYQTLLFYSCILTGKMSGGIIFRLDTANQSRHER